jgi:hypothetical protein
LLSQPPTGFAVSDSYKSSQFCYAWTVLIEYTTGRGLSIVFNTLTMLVLFCFIREFNI